jgi:hypothetical protein
VIPRATTAALASFVQDSIQRQETTGHLQHTPDAFAFRFDRRWRETTLFIRVLHRAFDALPNPDQRLTAERIGS